MFLLFRWLGWLLFFSFVSLPFVSLVSVSARSLACAALAFLFAVARVRRGLLPAACVVWCWSCWRVAGWLARLRLPGTAVFVLGSLPPALPVFCRARRLSWSVVRRSSHRVVAWWLVGRVCFVPRRCFPR